MDYCDPLPSSVSVAYLQGLVEHLQRQGVDPARLLRLMTQAGSGLRVTPGHQILAPAPAAADAPKLFDSARRLLAQLGA